MTDNRQQAHYWKELGDESAPRSIKDRAQWHEHRRQKVIASILLELHLMAATEIIPKSARGFTLIKARWQDAFGSAEKETQFAHCAPRQLIVYTREPQELLRDILPERSDYLRELFGKNDTLPTNFNFADSFCENQGLVEGFRMACHSAIASGHESSGNIKTENVSVDVKVAFDTYKLKAKDVFLTCASILSEKLIFPRPLPDNERRWKEQLMIIESYANALRSSTVISAITELGEVENLVNIYKKIAD